MGHRRPDVDRAPEDARRGPLQPVRSRVDGGTRARTGSVPGAEHYAGVAAIEAPANSAESLWRGRGDRMDAATLLLRLWFQYPPRHAGVLQLQLYRARCVRSADR